MALRRPLQRDPRHVHLACGIGSIGARRERQHPGGRRRRARSAAAARPHRRGLPAGAAARPAAAAPLDDAPPGCWPTSPAAGARGRAARRLRRSMTAGHRRAWPPPVARRRSLSGLRQPGQHGRHVGSAARSAPQARDGDAPSNTAAARRRPCPVPGAGAASRRPVVRRRPTSTTVPAPCRPGAASAGSSRGQTGTPPSPVAGSNRPTRPAASPAGSAASSAAWPVVSAALRQRPGRRRATTAASAPQAAACGGAEAAPTPSAPRAGGQGRIRAMADIENCLFIQLFWTLPGRPGKRFRARRGRPCGAWWRRSRVCSTGAIRAWRAGLAGGWRRQSPGRRRSTPPS